MNRMKTKKGNGNSNNKTNNKNNTRYTCQYVICSNKWYSVYPVNVGKFLRNNNKCKNNQYVPQNVFVS